MSSFLSNTEIESILNSGSYREFQRLVPALQEGMHRLRSRWERSEKMESAYGTPLTANITFTNDDDYESHFRIYTQKEAVARSASQGRSATVVDGVKYTVIASHCYDEFDGRRSNVNDSGEVHVSLLAYKKGEKNGPIYLLGGSYGYDYHYDQVFDYYSIPGYSEGPRSMTITSYTEDGECVEQVVPLEEEFAPGLVLRSAVRLADFMPQLSSSTKHKGYANFADTREVFNIRDFKKDLAFIATYATELSLNFNTLYTQSVDEAVSKEVFAKLEMESVADIHAAICERVQELCSAGGVAASIVHSGKSWSPKLNITFPPTTPFAFLQTVMTDSRLLKLIRDSSPLFYYNDFQAINPANGKRWSLSYGLRTYTYFGKKNEGKDLEKRNAKATFNFPA